MKAYHILLIIFSIIIIAMSCRKETMKMKNIKYGSHTHQKMDISLPASAGVQHKVPIVLCIHGGAWISGDKADFDYIKKDLHKVNCAYVSINYRLLDDNVTYKEMLDDINSAIEYLKTHAETYHLKTDKMAMIGSSAGAHLALLYAYSANSPIKVACLASRVGPTDFLDHVQQEMNGESHLAMLNKLTGTNVTQSQANNPNFTFPEEWSLASPIYHVKSTVPPTVLAYGLKDELVSYSNATRLNDKLEEFGIEHHLITFPNSGHELGNDPSKSEEYKQVLYDYITRFLF